MFIYLVIKKKTLSGILYLILLTIYSSDYFPHFQLLSTLGVVGGGVGALLFALEQSVQASGGEAHSPHQPWSHDGWFKSFDHARYVTLRDTIFSR